MNSSTLQTLVDSYQDIPALMTRMRESNTVNTTRFHPVIVPNQSVQAEQALRGHQKIDCRTSDLARVSRMAQQAKKVLTHISKLPSQPNSPSSGINTEKSRSIKDNAHRAAQKLDYLQKNGVDLKRFYSQYDVQKNGRVSYKDFADTMMHLSSGVSKHELYSVARALDTQKTGSLSYDNLLQSLKAISDDSQSQRRSQYSSNTGPSLSSSLNPSIEKDKIPSSKSVVDVVDLDTLLTANLAVPYDYESAQSKAERKRSEEQLLSFQRIFHESCPYYSDKPSSRRRDNDDTLSNRSKNKRASSAPPRAERSSFYREHYKHDGIRPSTEINLVPESTSLRTHIDFLKEKNYPSKLGLPSTDHRNEVTVSSDDETFHSPLIIEARQRKKSMDEYRRQVSKTVFNRLLYETRGNIPVLRRLLQQQDVSNSGRVSADELRRALQKAGVCFSEDEHVVLYQHLSGQTKEIGSEASSRWARPVNRSLSSSSILTTTNRLSSQAGMVSSASESKSIHWANGEGVDIDHVLDQVAARTASSAFQHLLQDQISVGNSKVPNIGAVDMKESAESGRIARKVLESLQRHGEPVKLLQDIAKQSSVAAPLAIVDTPLNWTQLKDMLRFAQSNLSTRDLQILQRSLNMTAPVSSVSYSKDVDCVGGSRRDESVNSTPSVMLWGDIEKKLQDTTKLATDVSYQSTSVNSFLQKHRADEKTPRYSKTFASTVFQHTSSTSFNDEDNIAKSRLSLGDLVDSGLMSSSKAKKDCTLWAKILDKIHAEPEKLTAAFSTSSLSPIGDGKPLGKRLREAGIVLSPDDISRLESYLEKKLHTSHARDIFKVDSIHQSGRAGLEFFCASLDMPTRQRSDVFQRESSISVNQIPDVHFNKHRTADLEALDPRSIAHDDGVFVTSRRSLSSNPTFATTMAVVPNVADRLSHYLLPVAKRRAQSVGRFNSLSEYLSQRPETSSFWEMRSSVDNAMLFPTLPNSSTSYPKDPVFFSSAQSQEPMARINKGRARQGVVSLQSFHSSQTDGSKSDRILSAGRNCVVESPVDSSRERVNDDEIQQRRRSRSLSSNVSVASTIVPIHTKVHSINTEINSAGNSAASTPNYNTTNGFSNRQNSAITPTTSGKPEPRNLDILSKWSNNTLSAYYRERDNVFGGAIAQSTAADHREKSFQKERFSRPSSPTSSLSVVSSPASSVHSSSQSRGRRLLKSHAASVESNNLFKTPESSANVRVPPRSRSLPPYATHEGY